MYYPQCSKCKKSYCREETYNIEELPKFCPMRYKEN